MIHNDRDRYVDRSKEGLAASEYYEPECMAVTVTDPVTVLDASGKKLYTTYLIQTEVCASR